MIFGRCSIEDDVLSSEIESNAKLQRIKEIVEQGKSRIIFEELCKYAFDFLQGQCGKDVNCTKNHAGYVLTIYSQF